MPVSVRFRFQYLRKNISVISVISGKVLFLPIANSSCQLPLSSAALNKFQPFVDNFQALDGYFAGFCVQDRACPLGGPRPFDVPAQHGLPLLVEQSDGHVRALNSAVDDFLDPVPKAVVERDSALEYDVAVL